MCISQAVEQISHQNRLFCARYGSDEFLMLKSGKCLFDRESIGNETSDTIIQMADEKLYEAKAKRIC